MLGSKFNVGHPTYSLKFVTIRILDKKNMINVVRKNKIMSLFIKLFFINSMIKIIKELKGDSIINSEQCNRKNNVKCFISKYKTIYNFEQFIFQNDLL
jgi:hypothetical protein